MTAKPITQIPLLDYALVTDGRKSEFLEQLRYAFIVVGFCYLKNAPVDQASGFRPYDFLDLIIY